MSWRDRLARRDLSDHADTASRGTETIGTISIVGNDTLSTKTDHADAVSRPTGASGAIGAIGTIGNETLSPTTSHAAAKEKDRSDHDPSPEVVRDSLAISVESANRTEILSPVSKSGDDVSAKSGQSVDPISISRDATSAIDAVSADDAGAREKIWGEAEEERAAIIEYDGGILRSWAEGFARLHPDRPPGGVPLRRWQQFVDDVGQFLDGPFRAVAAALGWGAHDLFGCNRDRPFAHIDQAGLLWLLKGDKLIVLSENTAMIETRTGARQTFRRRPVAIGEVVLAWELVP